MSKNTVSVSPQSRSIYKNENANKIPILFMMQGIVGSGKSYLADTLYVDRLEEVTKPVIHSSDALRQELYGDENVQSNNNELFNKLHKRIKNDLSENKDVIYDATNISKKRRIAFLQELKNINCFKVSVCVMTPYNVCISQNNNRERKVPEDVIRKMYLNWNPSNYDEGFDDIVIAYNYGTAECRQSYTLKNFFEDEIGADNIDQENKHHTYTIGQHCRATAAYIKEKYPNDIRLQTSALLHDIGKPFTKSHLNSRGEEDKNCHYYNHHCCGSYDSFFYMDNMNVPFNDRIYIANIIYYHMMPFTSWPQSEKARNKDKNLIGLSMYNDILKINEADLASH